MEGINQAKRVDWLSLARWSWIFLTLLLIAVFIAGMVPRYRELTTLCSEDPCIPLTLNEKDAGLLNEIGGNLHAYALYHIGLEIVVSGVLALLGGLLFWRMSHTWFGVALAYALVLFGLNFMVESDAALVSQYPNFKIPFDIVTALTAVLFMTLFFVFPDGHFVPGWGRYVILLLAIFSLLDPIFRAFGLVSPSRQFNSVFLFAFIASLFSGIYAQIYRYRYVSSPVARQQTKWVIFGLVTLVVAVLTYSFFVELFPPETSSGKLIFNVLIFSLLVPLIIFFPATFVISILRYRLWDIDLIVRRTLLYAIVTGLLILIYFGGVTILQSLFTSLTGQQSALAIVLSTLMIAALFNPLRQRTQTLIDRRFFRQKYNAEQIMDAFAEKARNEADLDELTQELVQTLESSMQPESVQIWLKRS